MTPKAEVQPWTSENLYLRGPYAPVFDERDEFQLPIEGEIPRSLNGMFLRNGPNPQFEPSTYTYPLDGTGMIHGVYLENGTASYRNRWVLTREMLLERAAGHRLFGPTLRPDSPANLANTHIIRHGNRLLALFEGGAPYELDRELNTIGEYTYQGLLPRAMSAHPKIDPETGELIALAYDARNSTLDFLTVDRAGVMKKAVSFDSPWPAMIHDIAVTKNYVIAFVCPFVLERPVPQWRPALGTAVAVIPRRGTERGIRWIECRPFFHFHVMNAFETGKYIEVQLPWFSSYGQAGLKSRLELHRLRINLDTRTVVDDPVDDCACEFPRINERFATRENRFGYVAFRNPRLGEDASSGVFEAIARYDFKTGARAVHTFPAGHFAGEPVFVAASDAAAEDEGFLMTFVYDAANDTSTFNIYDARNLNAEPLARARLPRRVPAGLHGSWIPNYPAEIQEHEGERVSESSSWTK